MDKKKEILTSVHDKHAADIYRYLSVRTYDRLLAEDIVQEVFEKFQQELNRGIMISHPRAWLFRVARNRLTRLSSRNKRSEPLDLHQSQLVSESVAKMDELIEQEQVKLAITHLRFLDNETQDVILFKIWEELKFSEIAERLSLKENTVKQKYYRGLEKIRDRMSNTNNLFGENSGKKLSVSAIVSVILNSKDTLPIFKFNHLNLVTSKIMTNSKNQTGAGTISTSNLISKFLIAGFTTIGITLAVIAGIYFLTPFSFNNNSEKLVANQSDTLVEDVEIQTTENTEETAITDVELENRTFDLTEIVSDRIIQVSLDLPADYRVDSSNIDKIIISDFAEEFSLNIEAFYTAGEIGYQQLEQIDTSFARYRADELISENQEIYRYVNNANASVNEDCRFLDTPEIPAPCGPEIFVDDTTQTILNIYCKVSIDEGLDKCDNLVKSLVNR